MKTTYRAFTRLLAVSGIALLAMLPSACGRQPASPPPGYQNPATTSGQNPPPAQTDTRYLDLSGQGLTSLPLNITDNTKLTKLDLSDNELTSLPSQIGKLANLEELILDNNKLQGSIVAEIRQMPKLRILSAKNNNLTGIPAEIGQLRRLETIDFSNNGLDTMPMEISNIKGNLKTFNLSGNKYSQQQINDLKAALPDTNIIY